MRARLALVLLAGVAFAGPAAAFDHVKPLGAQSFTVFGRAIVDPGDGWTAKDVSSDNGLVKITYKDKSRPEECVAEISLMPVAGGGDPRTADWDSLQKSQDDWATAEIEDNIHYTDQLAANAGGKLDEKRWTETHDGALQANSWLTAKGQVYNGIQTVISHRDMHYARAGIRVGMRCTEISAQAARDVGRDIWTAVTIDPKAALVTD